MTQRRNDSDTNLYREQSFKAMSNFSLSPPKNLSANFSQWLCTIQRLSHTLEDYGQVSLTIEQQSWQPSQTHEAETLQAQDVYAREITLALNSDPVSYGRVAIAKRDWNNFSKIITDLGKAPIGETLLHHNESIQRSTFHYSDTWMPPSIIHKKIGPSVARYSVFETPMGKLMLTESLSITLASLYL